MHSDLSRTLGVSSNSKRTNQSGPPDGVAFWEGRGDDLVHGREAKRVPWSDTPSEVQHQPVLPQHPRLEPILAREEMALWLPCQRPPRPLKQGVDRGVVLYRELPPNREGQLRPVVGAADQPLLVLHGASAS